MNDNIIKERQYRDERFCLSFILAPHIFPDANVNHTDFTGNSVKPVLAYYAMLPPQTL